MTESQKLSLRSIINSFYLTNVAECVKRHENAVASLRNNIDRIAAGNTDMSDPDAPIDNFTRESEWNLKLQQCAEQLTAANLPEDAAAFMRAFEALANNITPSDEVAALKTLLEYLETRLRETVDTPSAEKQEADSIQECLSRDSTALSKNACRVLEFLKEKHPHPQTYDDITGALDMSRTTVSNSIKGLKALDLIVKPSTGSGVTVKVSN